MIKKLSYQFFKMNDLLVVVLSIYFVHIQTENITLNPGDEKLYGILTGDTITLQCPMNSSRKSEVRWSYMKDTIESILSIGKKSNTADFSFSVDFTKNLQNVTHLRIYNITSKEQRIYKCYHSSLESNVITFEYDYNIRLTNVTSTIIENANGSVCCVLHGRKISSNKFKWEHRTLYGEHIRFIESVHENNTDTLKGDVNLTTHTFNDEIACLNLNKNGIVEYESEGEYICTAQFVIHGRNEIIDKTTSIKIENIQDRPFCIQDIRRQHEILGTNITIAINFYSKPKYSALSLRKHDNKLHVTDIVSVFLTNISLDVYNVTVMGSGYKIILNITEFSEEDVGNYTVNIANEFGYCNCTVQLLFQEDIKITRYPSGNVIEGQSVLFICQSISRRTTNNYSWTKNGITLSNSSSIVLENITQYDNGNYTCRMKNEEIYFTKNELLIVNPLTCTAYLPDSQGLLLMRFLNHGNFIVPFVLLVVSVICNIFIHLYCKKLKKITFETDENDRSRERIEMIEADNEYHTINEDSIRIDDTEIENRSEITSSIQESMDITEVQFPGVASDRNEQHIEEDDYLNPYCTLMENTIEIHEYKSLVPAVVPEILECVVSDDILNLKPGSLYENTNF